MSTGRVTASFPATADSAAGARDFVGATLVGWQYPTVLVDQARLLTSELVSNAIRHAATTSCVTVERRDGVVRVQVEDGGHGRAVVCAPSTDALAGRGLHIVDSIAALWGHGPCPNGYAVWFELGNPTPPADEYARSSGGGT